MVKVLLLYYILNCGRKIRFLIKLHQRDWRNSMTCFSKDFQTKQGWHVLMHQTEFCGTNKERPTWIHKQNVSVCRMHNIQVFASYKCRVITKNVSKFLWWDALIFNHNSYSSTHSWWNNWKSYLLFHVKFHSK